MNVPKARVVRIQRVVDRDPLRPPGLPSTPEVIAVDVSSQHRIPRVVHWCLLLYVFSVPLELVNLGFTIAIFVVLEDSGVGVLYDLLFLLQSAAGLVALTVTRLPVVSGLYCYL